MWLECRFPVHWKTVWETLVLPLRPSETSPPALLRPVARLSQSLAQGRVWLACL